MAHRRSLPVLFILSLAVSCLSSEGCNNDPRQGVSQRNGDAEVQSVEYVREVHATDRTREGRGTSPDLRLGLNISSLRSSTPKGNDPCDRSIKGPCRHHRVAIVGAGIAGLHMAHLLKKMGFQKIVVLEKEDRVGGKIMTAKHNGVLHEMGACYTSPDYESVYQLAEEFGIDDYVSVDPGTVWLRGIPAAMTFLQYAISEIMREKGVGVYEAAKLLNYSAKAYIDLHRDYFGQYEGELMYRPDYSRLRKLKVTFMEFLKLHKLTALIPIMRVTQTMQGYGQLDTVSVIYGMLWNTPELINEMLTRSGGEDSPIKMFRNGFSQVIMKLKENLDIRRNARITKIKRKRGSVYIQYNDGAAKTEKFNFLIWAANAKDALSVLHEPASHEKVFNRIKTHWFTTTIFDSVEKDKSLSHVDYWLSNLVEKKPNGVWGRRESREVLYENVCQINHGETRRVTSVAYQYSTNSENVCIINKKLNHHLRDFGARNISIELTKKWEYFPHFSVEDMGKGVLWDILDNQGKMKTWFIGSSVSFDSVKSVIEYNKGLIRKWCCFYRCTRYCYDNDDDDDDDDDDDEDDD